MERLSDGDGAAGCEEEEKKRSAHDHVAVGSLSLLLAGMMVLMACSHGDAPLWLVSELCAVLCLLLYLWAYHLTQNLAAGAVVPVETLVFSFPLVFCAGILAALLAVAVGPVAGMLVMVTDRLGMHVCLLRVLPRRAHVRSSKPPAGHKNKRVQDKIASFQN